MAARNGIPNVVTTQIKMLPILRRSICCVALWLNASQTLCQPGFLLLRMAQDRKGCIGIA